MFVLLLVLLMLWVVQALRLLRYPLIAQRAVSPTMTYNDTSDTQGHLKSHLERCLLQEFEDEMAPNESST